MRWTENVGGGRVLRKGAPGPLRPPAKLRVSGDRHAIHALHTVEKCHSPRNDVSAARRELEL